MLTSLWREAVGLSPNLTDDDDRGGPCAAFLFVNVCTDIIFTVFSLPYADRVSLDLIDDDTQQLEPQLMSQRLSECEYPVKRAVYGGNPDASSVASGIRGYGQRYVWKFQNPGPCSSNVRVGKECSFDEARGENE